MAEPIETQFWIWSRIDQGNTTWAVDAPMGRGTFGPTEKHCKAQDFEGWVIGTRCAKNRWPILKDQYIA